MPSNVKLNAESFVGLVRQSKLVDPESLAKTWSDLSQRGIDPDDPKHVADEFVARNLLTRWQADKLLQRKHKGFFLGKYRLLSHLGSGGMSAVYLAEHILMRRRVAIKVLPQARVTDTSYLQRFHREAQAVASLDHRNIVRAYDVDQEGNIHFLVMEYVSGKSLHDLVMSEGRLDCVRGVEYARQAADGLQHAHRMGMVHRDIKPGNLLLDDKGTIKLLDLGLARYFEDKEENSLTIQHDEKVLGTADFLSPEQALNSHNVDVRSDIYSLGCTLYFLLAAHPPFPEGTLAQRLLAHQTKEPESLAKLRPDIPPSLMAIIERMMAKKPEARYQTAREASAAMRQWLTEHGGATWALMNPTAAGGSSLIPASDKPSSDVLESDTVAHGGPTGDEGTDVSSRIVPASPPDGAANAAVADPRSAGASTEASHPEPELAAFLSHLAAEDSPSRALGGTSAVETPASASPETDRSFAPTAVIPKKGDSGSNPSPGESGGNRSREGSSSPAPTRQSSTKEGSTPGKTGDTRRGTSSSRTSTPIASARESEKASRTTPADSGSGRQMAGAASASPNAPAMSGSAGSTRLPKGATIGAAFALLLVAAAGFLFFNRGNPGGNTGDPGAGKSPNGNAIRKKNSPAIPLRRELTVGPEGMFRTIAEALADARENGNDSRKATQVIKVASRQTYPERIVIDETFPRGIQIVAEEGPPPILAPPGPEPIVAINGGKEQIENFRLEGFDLHGSGRETTILLSGWTPALKLRRLRIGGFSASGVLFDGTQTFGADNDRIVLEDLSFRDAGADAVGIRFQRKADDPMHVRVQRCRFLPPLAAGISFNSGAIDVEILESIFFSTKSGVRLEGTGRTWRDLILAFNTFYDVEQGIVWTNMPGGASHGFGFHNNLFVGSKSADAIVERDFSAGPFFSMCRTTPAAASHNWTSRPKPDPIPPEQLPFLFENMQGRYGASELLFQSLDPENAAFLAPVAGSPQQHAGTLLERRRFGDQIGAVRGK